MEFPSYPKVYSLGHRALVKLFAGPVVIQEKVDGSQINFRWDEQGALHVRSKGSWQYGGPDSRVEPDKMFKPAVEHLLDVGGPGGSHMNHHMFFRGECVTSPKHNVLAYERAAQGGIVLFDVVDQGWNPSHIGLDHWADGLGVDYVESRLGYAEKLETLELMVESAKPLLGGPHVEGLVFKNFDRFDRDGKPLMGKLVRAEFKEKHEKEWKGSGKPDPIERILNSLNTEARFEKAVQHLRDEGQLSDSPADIGKLMVEVKTDTIAEEIDWIKDKLWEAYGPPIQRGVGRGLPEWYKGLLAERQFADVR